MELKFMSGITYDLNENTGTCTSLCHQYSIRSPSFERPPLEQVQCIMIYIQIQHEECFHSSTNMTDE